MVAKCITNPRTGRKTVLFAHKTRGIGKGIALEFIKQGADVVLHYAHSRTGAEEVANKAQNSGVRAVAMKADFADIGEVQTLGSDAVNFLGGLDVLINNAGITMTEVLALWKQQTVGCDLTTFY